MDMSLLLLACTLVVLIVGTQIRTGRRMRTLSAELERSRSELLHEQQLGTQRDEMLSGMSHDLRSPLTVLTMASHELVRRLNGTGTDAAFELAGDIENSARRIDLLLSELLDLARAESGRLRMHCDAVVVANVVAEAIGDTAIGAVRSAVQIESDIPSDAVVHADRARLRTALRNLLENAEKYATPPFRVTFVEKTDVWELHVQDAGPGVPVAERHLVFDRFQRGTTANGHSGTGIGLYLSRQMITLQRGSLTIHESPLGGADFVIALPRDRPDLAPQHIR